MNKLKEILDEFHSLYGWRLQDDLQQEVREYLCNKIVEYARSIIPTPEEVVKEFFIGDKTLTQVYIDRIDQDLTSLNN